MKLQTKLQTIQSTLVAPKNLRNSFGNYNYRSCEGILEALKPMLNSQGITLLLTDEIKEVAGVIYCEATAKLIFEEEVIEVKAQAGVPTVKKGMDLSQIFGASSSYARKYALNGMFLIDDNRDADTQDNRPEKVFKPQPKAKAIEPTKEQIAKWKAFAKSGGDLQNVVDKYNIPLDKLKVFLK